MYEAKMTARLARALRKARQDEDERLTREQAARSGVVNTDHATEVSVRIIRMWFDAYMSVIKIGMVWM